MPYRLPDFNLTCSIRHMVDNDYDNGYDGDVLDCQLRGPQQGPRGGVQFQGNFADVGACQMLLVPAGSDIRDCAWSSDGWPDLVEVPVLSGRWYSCFIVDDIGKGFANEHRFAILSKAGGTPSFNRIVNVPTPVFPIP